MSNYTEPEIISNIEEASQDMQMFYQQKFVNYRGRTSDTKKRYTEIIAGYLLEHLELFSKINVITRGSSYKVSSHDGILQNKTSNRQEERIAIDLYHQKELPKIGKVLDYQIPLKNVQKDKETGKIDLMTYDGKNLYLLELKKPDSKETMLRCVLEAYTYSKILDQKKILEDFDLPDTTKIDPCPLVFKEGDQKKEMDDNPEKLTQLINALDIRIFYLEVIDHHYQVQYGN